MTSLIHSRVKGSSLRLEWLKGPVATVEIQTKVKNHTFHIHRDALVAYSSYFSAALSSSFREGFTQHITLEEENPELFSVVVHWLYSGRIQLVCQRARDIQRTLVELWALSDRRGIPALQNHVVDALHQSVLDHWKFEDRTLIKTLFEVAPRNAKVLDWVVELYVTFGEAARLDKWGVNGSIPEEELPELFLLKLGKRLFEKIGSGPRNCDYKGTLKHMDLCQFHVHEEEGETCAADD